MCDVCHYWYFLSKDFNYEPYLCNGCHHLIRKVMNFNDVAIQNSLLVYEQKWCDKHNEQS